ncbi:MAG: anthranilate 1,2-dioxygenase small subunit [Gammaproteobacteria bacterium]|jgi:anthranilate 1,2-dioxygenase small subunit
MDLSCLSKPELQFHVEQLQGRYVECIDDDRLEEWPELFFDKCLYKIISRENYDRALTATAMFCDSKGMLVDRVVSLRYANIYAEHHYRHILSNILIKNILDGVITVQSNYLVMQTKNDGATNIYNTGRYLDKIEVDGDELKFREKTAVFDTHQIQSLLVTPI